MRPHADQGDRPRARVVRGARRRTRPIAAGVGRARRHHPSLCPAPRRPRLSQPRAGRGDPARPATRRTHRHAPYRTRSAARLDRSAPPPGALTSDPRQNVSRPRPELFSLSALISRGGTASMPVREKQPRRAGSWPTRPFSGLVQAHTPGKRRAFAPLAMEGTGETDSVAEGTRIELLVPPREPRNGIWR